MFPRFAENGAAIATVFAEAAVALVCFINAKRFFEMGKIFSVYYHYWLAALPIPVIAVFARHFLTHIIARIGVVVFASAGCYFLMLLCWKNPYAFEGIEILQKKLKRKGTEMS